MLTYIMMEQPLNIEAHPFVSYEAIFSKLLWTVTRQANTSVLNFSAYFTETLYKKRECPARRPGNFFHLPEAKCWLLQATVSLRHSLAKEPACATKAHGKSTSKNLTIGMKYTKINMPRTITQLLYTFAVFFLCKSKSKLSNMFSN